MESKKNKSKERTPKHNWFNQSLKIQDVLQVLQKVGARMAKFAQKELITGILNFERINGSQRFHFYTEI